MSDSEREELIRLRQQTIDQQRQLAELQQSLKLSNESNADLRKMLADLQEKLDILIVQLKKRNRRDFGNKTERHNPRQGTTSTEETSTEIEKPVPKRPAAQKESTERKSRWQNLPARQVHHTVPADLATCPHCLKDTKFVRYEITTQLESLRQSVQRLEHLQEVRSCPKCKRYMVTAEKPCAPIPGSYAGPGLLADIAVDKLADGLPNYRQEKRYARQDVPVPRSTQCGWMIAISLAVRPLYELLKKEVLLSSIIQTDDSELKVRDRKHKRKMRKGKMTVYRGDRQHPYTVFDFSPTQTFERNIAFLKDFAGIVQADAATGFDALFRDGSKTEAGCSAHSRRRYYDCLVVDPINANTVLEIYDQLYKIEKRIKNATPEARLAIRRRCSKPLTKKLHKTIAKMRDSLNPTHPLMHAVNYTLTHWIALTRFLGYPELDVDNNSSEREIKGFVLDRKNFLFSGSDEGAEAISVLLSLIASAQRNKIDPRAYLTDVFSRINSTKVNELEMFLPDRWKQNQPKTS